MKLYVDYCPRCPRPNITVEGKVRNGPPVPSKCYHCTPKTFTEQLGQYVSAEEDMKKLRKEIEERQRGLKFYQKKRGQLHDQIKKNCKKDTVRVVSLTGFAVVLDWQNEWLAISGAPIERDPEK